MGSYTGVGTRMRERLLTLGYKRDDGEPDMQRFGWDHRFDKGHLYAWLRDEMTPFKDLTRLCDALDCSERWLLTGKERDPKASPGRARQHGKLKSLWLVLPLAAAALLSPSSGAASRSDTTECENRLNNPSYRKRPYAIA
jgi:hypothetical protein